MSKRAASSNPVSLFPFLAVLMSAMGALILLLLVVSRQAKEMRDREYQREQRSLVVDLPPLPERKSFPKLPDDELPAIPELSSPELPPLPTLDDPRTALSERLRMLRRQWEQVLSEPRPTLHTAGSQRVTDLEIRLDAIRRQLEEIRKAKEEALRQDETLRTQEQTLRREEESARRIAGQMGNRYSIVPYFGPNGTDRQPLYFECRQDRLILQPEGIELGPADLPDPTDRDNTLAKLIRTLLTFERSRGGRPYPLLIVRPDGVSTFYFARMSLAGVGTDYGYELVPGETPLEFGEPDEKVREVVARLLEEERRHPKSAVVARGFSLPAPGEGGNGDGFGPGGGGRGGSARIERTPREDLEVIARSLPDVRSLSSGARSGAGSYPEPGEPGGEESGSALGSRGGTADAGLGFDGDLQQDRPLVLRPGSSGKSSQGASADRPRGPSGYSEEGVALAPVGPGGRGESETAPQGTWSGAGGAKSSGSSSANGARLGPPEGTSLAARGSGEAGAQGSASANASGSRSRSGSTSQGNNGSASSSMSGSTSSSANGAMNGSEGGTAGGSESAAEPTEFEQALMQLGMGSPGGGGQPSLKFDASDGKAPKGADAGGGEGNAAAPYPLGPTGSTSYTVPRSVTIECRETGVTLYPGGTFVPFDDATLESTKQAIYRHVAEQLRAWGQPDDFRQYVPVLEFAVRPDGLGRYYDLRLALARSGLSVTHRVVEWGQDLDFREFFGAARPAESARKPGAVLRR